MLPDKTLDECIELVLWWFNDAIRRRDETGDFEYTIQAHRYNQILRHLRAYKELLENGGYLWG
jgi:hypothetical protein